MTSAPLKISIVTPSLNQSRFLEDSILSVINQQHPNLEYIIIDGGSKDGTIDIIRKYQKYLKFWVSEKDSGQYDAINKGFSKTTGDIMAWLNSDDQFTPWAFSIVGQIFSLFPEIQWITTLYPLEMDELGRPVQCSQRLGYNKKGFFRGENLVCKDWYSNDWIQQESTFWRRSLWEKAGGYLDSTLEYAADFELWSRYFKFSELHGIGTPLGSFRRHKNQKTYQRMDNYVKEAKSALIKHGGRSYGRLGSGYRFNFRKIIPMRFRGAAIKLGLLFPCPIVQYDRNQWVKIYR